MASQSERKAGWKMTQSALSAESSDKLLRIVSLTLTIAVMCATMFNIVLGQIKAEFGLGYSEVSWISSAYLLIYAIGSVIYGKLADIYKLKNVVTFGFATFAIGSLIGLAANSYGMLLAPGSFRRPEPPFFRRSAESFPFGTMTRNGAGRRSARSYPACRSARRSVPPLRR